MRQPSNKFHENQGRTFSVILLRDQTKGRKKASLMEVIILVYWEILWFKRGSGYQMMGGPMFLWAVHSITTSGNTAQAGMLGQGPRLFLRDTSQCQAEGEADTERRLHREETPPLGRRGCGLSEFKYRSCTSEVPVHIIHSVILRRACESSC